MVSVRQKSPEGVRGLGPAGPAGDSSSGQDGLIRLKSSTGAAVSLEGLNENGNAAATGGGRDIDLSRELDIHLAHINPIHEVLNEFAFGVATRNMANGCPAAELLAGHCGKENIRIFGPERDFVFHVEIIISISRPLSRGHFEQ